MRSTVPEMPNVIGVLADADGHARYAIALDVHDIRQAHLTQGVYVLVVLQPDGTATIATKPGNSWSSTWSPPHELERR